MAPRPKPTRYRLGGGHGTITVSGRRVKYDAGLLAPAHFDVGLDDVRGFTRTGGGLSCHLRILGEGIELACIHVTGAAANKIEAWFHQHAQMGRSAEAATGGGGGMATELERIAALHHQGYLSAEEFAAAKAKLLS